MENKITEKQKKKKVEFKEFFSEKLTRNKEHKREIKEEPHRKE
jgi:hypothetical protein